MKRSVVTLLALGLVLGPIVAPPGAAGPPLRAFGKALKAAGPTIRFRWDIVSYTFGAAPVTVSMGGKASAKASDRSTIVLTGTGTFGGTPTNVTGGGTWTTLGSTGGVIGAGTYKVKALIGFFAAPGSFGDVTGTYQLSDQIGDSADAHAGLALLRIAYSDGSQGILTISSRQAGSPPSVFMGITATKGFAAYWIHQPPVPDVDAERALFHVVR